MIVSATSTLNFGGEVDSLFTEVLGRGLLGSWTSALRSSPKFEGLYGGLAFSGLRSTE